MTNPGGEGVAKPRSSRLSSEYWVAAVEHIHGDADWGEWQDPDVLTRLIAGAQRVQVGEGQQVTPELRLTRLIR